MKAMQIIREEIRGKLMERNVSLEDIWDGKYYELNDLAKVGCNDCAGCSACCHGMGKSIVLDPLDIYNLEKGLNKNFENLLQDNIELNVVDGIIMPNLRMAGSDESCTFLNSEGRCSIHPFRPSICRLFPLGRIYEDGTFRYINQVHECVKSNKTKIKVKNWIDTPDIKNNETFIKQWHNFKSDIKNMIRTAKTEELIRQYNLYILKEFYLTQYNTDMNFYEQFNERLIRAKKNLNII